MLLVRRNAAPVGPMAPDAARKLLFNALTVHQDLSRTTLPTSPSHPPGRRPSVENGRELARPAGAGEPGSPSIIGRASLIIGH